MLWIFMMKEWSEDIVKKNPLLMYVNIKPWLSIFLPLPLKHQRFRKSESNPDATLRPAEHRKEKAKAGMKEEEEEEEDVI